MKKTMILAAFAALVSLASCQKEEVIDNNGTDKNASPVFTASIAGATKTTVNLTDGKVAWEADDEITITDASSASALYEIESIDETTGKATFVIKEGESAIGAGPYTATYGTEPATSQTYSATAGKLYMTAPETSSKSFTFTAQCGLMKLNLTSPDESVKSIAVSNSTATYTLTCDPAQSIASAKDFCIALPAGSYTKIEITNAEDVTCTLNSASGVAVAANHIKPVTFDGSKLNFVLNIPDGALPGVFSVSDTKKVYFSQGNLWADSSNALHFEEAQWKTIPTSDDIMDTDHVSHFIWAGKVSEAVGNGYLGGNLFCDESHKVSVDGSDAIYYALSKDEWTYLFKTRTVNGNIGYSFNITFGGKIGLVLYPDNYSGTVLSGTVETLPQGVVFLPAAGWRYESDVYYIDSMGYYWSSSALEDDSTTAFTMEFDGVSVNTPYDESICVGSSIRLVTDVE